MVNTKARLRTNDTTEHEVVWDGREYVVRTWLRDPDMDNPLTREQAMEFIDTMKRTGQAREVAR